MPQETTDEEVVSVDASDVPCARSRMRKSLYRSVLLGIVGGLIVGLGANDVVIILRLWTGWKALLVSFFICVCLCGPFGYFCLPVDGTLNNALARGLVEGLVVCGWWSNVLFWVASAIQLHSYSIPYSVMLVAFALFALIFIPAPFWFILLCWNNVDWDLIRRLRRQFQFQAVTVLTVWIIVVETWREVSVQGWDVLSSSFNSILIWSPLFMILFIDAIKVLSAWFRLALPIAYIAFVIIEHLAYAYFAVGTAHPEPFCAVNPIIKSTPESHGMISFSSAGTFEGQIGISLLAVTCITLAWYPLFPSWKPKATSPASSAE